MALSRSESPVEMSTVTTSELGLGERIGEVSRRETRILVEDNGEPVAVIVSLADLRDIQTMERKRTEAEELLKSIRAGFSDLTDEEKDQMAEEVMAEAKAERQRQREQYAV